MLKWDIKIWNKFLECCQFFEMIECENIWIEIQQSVTKISGKFFDVFEKFEELRFSIDIRSISCRILSNENDFLCSLMNKHLYFFKNFFPRKGFLSTSDLWDNAKRAGIIAPFCDFEIFKFIVNICQSSWIF